MVPSFSVEEFNRVACADVVSGSTLHHFRDRCLDTPCELAFLPPHSDHRGYGGSRRTGVGGVVDRLERLTGGIGGAQLIRS